MLFSFLSCVKDSTFKLVLCFLKAFSQSQAQDFYSILANTIQWKSHTSQTDGEKGWLPFKNAYSVFAAQQELTFYQ